MSDERKIVDLNSARRERERAEREAAKAAKRAAEPPRDGVRPALYWTVVVALIFALAGGYTLVAAI
ncbi:MAG: hypothetical protein QM698_14655 [Micropepsaceae bacterium]